MAAHQLPPRQILERMAELYANCRSYQDSGFVRTRFIRGHHTRVVIKEFQTLFVRPDQFRFEYRESKSDDRTYRCIVWARGDNVQTWWDVRPGVKTVVSLGLAIAGATGISSGAACTIPSLLMPEEVDVHTFIEMIDLRRLEDAEHQGRPCLRIAGQCADEPTVLWLDLETLLIRRIDSQSTFADFRTEKTSVYWPQVDRPIAPQGLEFRPPTET